MKIDIGYGLRQQACSMCLLVIEAQDKAIRLVENNEYIHKIYHPKCFEAYINWYYETHPYTKRIRGFGRPRLDLTDEQYRMRMRWMRDKSKLKVRKESLVGLRRWEEAEIVQNKIDELTKNIKDQVSNHS